MAFINRLYKLLLSVIVVSGMLGIKAQLLTGTSVILGDKHYYIETTKKANFYQAAIACAKYDMKLVSIENKDEYNRLYAILRTTDNLEKQYWLSGINIGVDNDLFTSLGTGKEVTYWPDIANKPTESNTCLNTDSGTFAYAKPALDCARSLNYICEKPLEPYCGKLGQCRYTYSYTSK